MKHKRPLLSKLRFIFVKISFSILFILIVLSFNFIKPNKVGAIEYCTFSISPQTIPSDGTLSVAIQINGNAFRHDDFFVRFTWTRETGPSSVEKNVGQITSTTTKQVRLSDLHLPSDIHSY